MSGIGGDDRTARARLGRWALRAKTVPESERREVIASRLPGPSGRRHPRCVVTAVDAESGEAVAWDRDSGVGLVDAVAASCAVPLVWPPMTINGRRYVDGGVRSPVNADYATGCSRVLVFAPITAAIRRSGRVSRQLASLGSAGALGRVQPGRRGPRGDGPQRAGPGVPGGGGQAGRRQAAGVVDAVAAVWS